jgi:hypothetical protein
MIAVDEDVRVLGHAKISIATATTTNADFGTPNDLNLAALTSYQPGDRILAVITATTAGTTDTTDFVVQDAPDSSGSIGTPATAVTDGTLTGGTGDQVTVVSVKVQAGRPWLRFAAHRASGTTDTTVVSVVVLAVRRSGV